MRRNRYAVGGHPVLGIPPAGTRGRSSMAEPQPSKLVMRVRFPSPAPTTKPRSEGVRPVGSYPTGPPLQGSRAIYVP